MIDEKERERRERDERKERARIERNLLIDEVQRCPDISPADKDHFRDALNATYAAANGSIDRLSDLATSNVLWARIHVRGFANDAKTARSLAEIKTILTKHVSEETCMFNRRDDILDVSKLSWSDVLKNAALRAPVWLAMTVTGITVALIAYGYGDRIMSLFIGE